MSDIEKTAADEAALIADLQATFPGLKPRPVSDFTSDSWMQRGVWFTGAALMPDGQPVYLVPADVGYREPPGYDGYMHAGFVAWLEDRGWIWECYDYGSYLILPRSASDVVSVHARMRIQEGNGAANA